MNTAVAELQSWWLGLETTARLPHAGEQLTLEAEYTGVTPADLFRFWTEPKLVTRWWPFCAEVEPREGGEYHFRWPGGLHLRGRYTAYAPGRHLRFSWRWEHEPYLPVRFVDVTFQATQRGTRQTLVHSEYAKEDSVERQEHLEGWLHFLDRLAEVTKGG